MNDWRWTAGTIAYMTAFAYAISLMVYQFGAWSIGKGSVVGTIFASLVLALFLFLLLRPNPNKSSKTE
jgi:ferrous iron transport protein B